MNQDFKRFHHVFIDNHADLTLVLLHGTGGNEEDFLFLNELLNKKYNLLGLRGNTQEHGMNRFFIRTALGVFDQESISREVENLHAFILAWIEEKQVSEKQFVYLGYSNGANMLLATLLIYPKLFHAIILLHSMIPTSLPLVPPELSHLKAFVSMGSYDTMIPPAQQVQLIQTLKSYYAQVTEKIYPGGHEISNQEIQDVLTFLA